MTGPLKQLLFRAAGADRPRIIAVIGVTRKDVEAAVAHALTSDVRLPVHAWCADQVEPADEAIAACHAFSSGTSAANIRKDLRAFWPALTIVSWTGERRAAAHKLLPFIVPPFRIVIANETQGFFAARPGSVAAHLRRRIRDAAVSAARRIGDWTGGLFLAFLSILAKCTPGLARAILRSLPDGKPAATLTVDSCGSRYTEIIVSGRVWMRDQVVDAARNSDADFIVFRRLGEKAGPGQLIDLARETRAFAVARQIAYAGWRKTLVAKHPFRQLQPGEVSEVAAPWSTLLVVRRDSLVRLGVPRATTFGGALLILFRQAAAAGLRSLVAGQETVLSQEPAMELEDAELVARLLLSRPLRSLAAAHPQRGRGNVAYSPRHQQEFRGLPRVLVVSPYLPFPLSHGGAVRMYNLCRAMAAQIDFVLACFREAGDTVFYDELHPVFREVYVVDIDEKHSDESVPKQVAEYRNSAMADLIRNICLARAVDAVQLEYTQMAEYRENAAGVPVILVEHDLTFKLHEQLANTLRDATACKQYELWHTFERAALQSSTVVWTMSEQDRAIALEHGAPRNATVVVPNGVDLRRFQPVRRQTQERCVLFVGSFRHLPNLLAFEVLRETIMPEVWKALPNVILKVIAGPLHERAADTARKRDLLAPDPRIRIHGFVEDVRPAYRECDVAVIPLPVSAGTNIKLMEAMACGRAIVSTPAGCQGLDLCDEVDLLIRDTGPPFAEAIIRLMNDEPARLKLAARARQVAESQFGWESIAACALESYAAIRRQTQTAERAGRHERNPTSVLLS